MSLLLVDDDEMSSQIFGYILSDEGYEVDFAYTGSSAIDKISSFRCYDLVLLDFVLPDMSGHDVANKIKIVNPNLKIILITGHEKNDEPLEPRYERIMQKPIPPDILIKTIAEILGRD